jgi:uncharacterized protein
MKVIMGSLYRMLLSSLLVLAGPALAAAPPPADDAIHAFDYDAKAPLDVRVAATEKQEGVTVQTLTYASPRGGRVPAVLVVPDGKGPCAGMLFLHGAPGDHTGMMPEAMVLARRGTVALLVDAPFARPERAGANFPRFDERDRADQVQLVVDLRRGVDLLLARPDVDPKRLGFLGISFGAATGGLFAGVEKRIAAYALVAGDGGMVSHFHALDPENDPLQRLPKEQAQRWLDLMASIEAIRFVGRAAPAHLLFQNGRQDRTVPPSAAKEFQDAGSQPKTVLWYDTDHRLGRQAIQDRQEWLADRLGIAKPKPLPTDEDLERARRHP